MHGVYVMITSSPYRPPRFAKNMTDIRRRAELAHSSLRACRRFADRLVGLGLFLALVGAQMTWMGFLGWAALRFLR